MTLLASLAGLTGCTQKPVRRCVDDSNKVVDDKLCRDDTHHSSFYPYHWYYGGPRGYVPLGTGVAGGSTTPPRGGFSSPSSSSTSRGVIGASGEAASGHASSGAHGGGAGE